MKKHIRAFALIMTLIFLLPLLQGCVYIPSVGVAGTGKPDNGKDSDESGDSGAGGAAGDGASGGGGEGANSAPDFRVSDGDGHDVRLSDFSGKPTVLNFWASWCPPCKSEMPDFEEAFKTYGAQVNFVMVNLTDGYYETVTGARKFISTAGYTFPVYFDIYGEAAAAYSIEAIPQTYFIDSNGKITHFTTGMISKSALTEKIETILSDGN